MGLEKVKTFIVLGMHRSATSLIAKGLAQSGVHVGDRLLGPTPCNRWGHFENVEFYEMNDLILSEAGGSWDNPPPENMIIKACAKYAREIEALVTKSKRSPFWGWKDPRTTLTIKGYLPFIENPHFITCFREPLEVATSLSRRDGSTIKQGMALANEYNRRLLAFLSEWTRESGAY